MELEEYYTIQNLLTQVSSISKKYENIAKITGENFNIFKVLKIESAEVRMHSAFIAELLDPMGSHGQGDSFLKIFIKRFHIEDFETTNAIIEIERFIGWINEDITQGGRIDIVISARKGKKIFIENKIYAGDQVNQLFRYHKYDPNAQLYYLTLDGKEPSCESKGTLDGKEFDCISYKNDIIEWLKECNKEAVNQPILRETITQYINLIKYLTHQTINDKMKDEVVSEIIKTPENIKIAIDIAEALSGVYQHLTSRFVMQIEEVLNELKINYSSLKFTAPAIEFTERQKESGFSLELSEWNFKIYFEFESEKLFYGIYNEKGMNIEDIDRIRKLLPIGEGNAAWVWWKWFDEWNTSWRDLLPKIESGALKNSLKETIKDMLDRLAPKNDAKISFKLS